MPSSPVLKSLATVAAATVVGGVGLAALGSPAAPAATDRHGRTIATAPLVDGTGRAVGRVTFAQQKDGVIGIATVALPADSPEFHGLHIHANADGTGCLPGTGFTGVGGHWDTGGHQHGSHTGDLPAVQRRSDGRADVTFTVDKFAAADLIGKAVIVHAGPDNFANVPLGPAVNQYTDNGTAFSGTGGTAATGNAGARFACGVIAGR